MISDVVATITFEIETWFKLRDQDFIKNPETSIFVHFAKIFFKCRHHF